MRHLFEAGCNASLGGELTSDLALLAIGGYGRGELNPYSDVDIMFLHPASMKSVSPKANEVIQTILYMLWDVGFKVGHSTRSVSGAIRQANTDMLSKTSLLEARFVAGNAALSEEFKAEFVRRCVRGSERKYLQERVLNQRERHEKHAGTVYLQEPNIKNGCGGLRDYQNLLWMAYFKEGIMTMQGLVEKKLLVEAERRKLDRAYDFLLRVRTELHYLNKRATDVVTLNFQLQLANKLNYTQKNALRRGEAFMREYYQHSRTVFSITELISARLAAGLEDTRAPGFFGMLISRPEKRESFDGFYSTGGLIYPEGRDIFNKEPHRMMRLFLYAQQRHLSLSAELQQLIHRRLHLVDRTFQYAKATRETFNAIISQKGQVGRILRMMHEVDFLGRYISEFGQLTCLVQHEFFHRYTADEHTLVCIEKLDQLIDTKEARLADYRSMFQRLEDPFVLYLALLLHDTGKASNARYMQRRAPFSRKRWRHVSSSLRIGASFSSCLWIII